jgi:stage II sporulation protein Q
MKKRKLKPWVKGIIIGCSCLAFMGVLFWADKKLLTPNEDAFNSGDDFDFVGKLIFDDTVPVVNTESQIIMRPYSIPTIEIIKNYYDYKAEASNQEDSLIFIDGTYLQNTGIVYGADEQFDVVSVLPGTVIEVKEDELLGKVIEIQHSNNIISVYECLDTTSVNEGDHINQGQTIAKTGATKITADAKYNLLFELVINGQTVNPTNYYDKNVNDL